MSMVAKNIKDFRLLRGLSQKRLADLLNKSVGTVANWEKGVNYPTVDVLEDLCKLLDVTPNQMYGWDPSPDLEAFLQEQAENLFQIEQLTKQRDELDERIKLYGSKILNRRY